MKKGYSANELEQLKQRAIQGDAEAQELWGLVLQYGDGVEEDYEEAIRWYERAAEQGRPLSQRKVGWTILMGIEGIDQDIERGLALLESAIAGGDAGAYAGMASAYMNGVGVDIDLEKAVSLAKKAVDMDPKPFNRIMLAGALFSRDKTDVDISEIVRLYSGVLADKEATLEHKEVADEGLEMIRKIETANTLKDALLDDIGGLQIPLDKKDGEEISRVLEDALSNIFEDDPDDKLLPSTLIKQYLSIFMDRQDSWYKSYADDTGSLAQAKIALPDSIGFASRSIIVEGDEIPLLVLSEDGKVLKLHPCYDLEDESIGEISEPLVATLANVGGDITMVRYIPGVEGHAYPTRVADDELEIDSNVLSVLDDGVGGFSVNRNAVFKIGQVLYRTFYRIQNGLKSEGLSIADVADELPDLFESIRSQLLTLKAELVEAEEELNDLEGTKTDIEPSVSFSKLQEEAECAMEDLYPVMQDLVIDPDHNIGQFPFFVQNGDQEILLVLHEDGSTERLEYGYELPDESFSQDVDGLVTVEAPDPLDSLRFIQILPGTLWQSVNDES